MRSSGAGATLGGVLVGSMLALAVPNRLDALETGRPTGAKVVPTSGGSIAGTVSGSSGPLAGIDVKVLARPGRPSPDVIVDVTGYFE